MSTNSNKLDVAKPYRSLGSYREAFDTHCNSLEEEIRTLRSVMSLDRVILEKEETLREVRLLMAEVDKSHAYLMGEEKYRHEKEEPKATFDMLWLLFPPAELVYTNINGFEIACRVRILVWEEQPQRRW